MFKDIIGVLLHCDAPDSREQFQPVDSEMLVQIVRYLALLHFEKERASIELQLWNSEVQSQNFSFSYKARLYKIPWSYNILFEKIND